MAKCFADISEESILELGWKMINYLSLEDKRSVLLSIRQVVNNTSKSIKAGFIFLFRILAPKNFDGDSDLISLSFGLVNLVCSDFVQLDEGQKSVTPFLDLTIQFAASQSLINISLSAFDLLWHVIKSVNDADFWVYFFDEVARVFADTRFDVACAAVKTVFSILCSNEIPTEVVRVYLNDRWPPLLRNETLSKNDPIFVLVLQEMAHFICTFWEQCNSDDLLPRFVPDFIKAHEMFVIHLHGNDLIFQSLEVYGSFLKDPNVSFDVQLSWGRSFEYIVHEKFKPIKNLNSPLLSNLGRFICNIIRSFVGRWQRVPFAEWLRIVTGIALTFKTNMFVHVTSQRALEGLTGVFPIPSPYSGMAVGALVDIYKRTDEALVRNLVIDDLGEVWGRERDRKSLLLMIKDVLKDGAAKGLCTTIVKEQLQFGDSEKERAAECYRTIAESHPELAGIATNYAHEVLE
jgi:hypothetical protein